MDGWPTYEQGYGASPPNDLKVSAMFVDLLVYTIVCSSLQMLQGTQTN